MSLVTGDITPDGALIDVFVGVSRILAIVSDDFDDWTDAPQALIGRDVLSKCNFSYHGRDGNWMLAF